MLAGDRVWAGSGWATCTPTLDFETYSEAGYLWDEALQKWVGLPGSPGTKRSLEVVGARNYITHPSADVVSLSYDLFNSTGLHKWTKTSNDWPRDLFDHVARGGLLEAWYVGFEFTVWNYFCVPRWGWPPLRLEQMRCAMAKARAFGYPGKLLEAGRVVASRGAALSPEQVAASIAPRAYDPADDGIPF